ncbi:Magnesium-chelatase subunit H [Gracilariopsis chorda]|uniref:magnesium chelatase n=1 Tax=Gracilariopsis chorda TaxID=448386 RepID=A0A2V3IER2_9FLOR|nr:Magnesium-chelatase subunit H [Gracilariopsis chorda]|eukprot:PXF40575.1 Magnesium-chelatase subunit H [Gracilariopsis chorda]
MTATQANTHSAAFLPPLPLRGALLQKPACDSRLSPASLRQVTRSVLPATPPSSSSRLNKPLLPTSLPARIVLIAGFETFNLSTYKKARQIVDSLGITLDVFTERDVGSNDQRLQQALRDADVVFCSLLFDYDQVEWLKKHINQKPNVFVFESALELMSETRVGSFQMKGATSKQDSSKSDMPKALKLILRKLGLIGREEDKLAGYLSMLKNAPKFLKLLPGRKVRDLRNWLTVYAYWNAGGVDNVVAMCKYIVLEVLESQLPSQQSIPEISQIPNMGLLHPEYDGFFDNPAQYLKWYEKKFPSRRSYPRVALLLYRKHVISKLKYIPKLISYLENECIIPVPVFITGVEAHIVVRDYLTSEHKENKRMANERIYGSYKRGQVGLVDAVVSTIGFPLVGGPAGSMAGARNANVGKTILQQMNVPYVVAAPLLIQDLRSWHETGVAGLQSVVLYSLPELDGAIDTVCIGGLVGDQIYLVSDRIRRLTGRLNKWIALKRKPNCEKRVAIIIYGFPPSIGATGTAALLNVPKSLSNILRRLHKAGYDVGDGFKRTPEEILQMVKQSDEVLQGGTLAGMSAREAYQNMTKVASSDLREWIGSRNTKRIENAWNGDLGSSKNIKTFEQMHLLGGVSFGNVWIGVQPPLGIVGDPMRMMFDRDLTPHPQYAAFYRWLEEDMRCDATIHVGTHGTYEWLPGNPLGNTKESWSDIFVGNLPNLYIYAANNPSEGSLAKRRGYATIVSHNVPPYGRSGLYGQLEEMKNLVWEFNEAKQMGSPEEKLNEIRSCLVDKIVTSGLNVDLGIDMNGLSASADFIAEVSLYLKTLESRLFSSGLHVLGKPPTPEEAVGYVEAIIGEDPENIPEEHRVELARSIVTSVMDVSTDPNVSDWSAFDSSKYQQLPCYTKARDVVMKLLDTSRELDNIVRGLDGEYIEAVPGGDVLRDGAGVLPTGANIHALDPYRLPSPAAYATGKAISERTIRAHQDEHDGAYPETVAVPVWGLDNIKTKGESVGIALGFLGARPVLDGTGRVVRFELIELEELGRPRIDVLLNLSGIFRDSFEHVVYLLDDVCRRAAEAEEPGEKNFVRKHAQRMAETDGEVDTGARLFSNPPGDYGSMVNEQVADSTWESGDELAETFLSRNAYIYGRDKGGKRDEVTFRTMLSTTSRVVQQIDSVEYGLSDIQEYYANTGALLRAARKESKNDNIRASIVESFGAARDGGAGREPKDLEQVLRMELRTRLLNPKWADKMLQNGAGGAFEVSTRMTALIGWGGTAGYGDKFVFEQAAERYVVDEHNRELLRKSSPEAFRNVLSRFLEAAGRGIWRDPDEELLRSIREQLDDVDSEIEGVLR